jgi:hypothetical protein
MSPAVYLVVAVTVDGREIDVPVIISIPIEMVNLDQVIRLEMSPA